MSGQQQIRPSEGRSPQENKRSSLLTNEENEGLFQLLGRKCITLSTAVVQLLMTSSPHQAWYKKHFGIACFVKDSSQRSYFIRIYDIIRNAMLWEQELYSEFTYIALKPILHSFEAEEGMAGLLFADNNEATSFHKAVEAKLRGRQQKKQERRVRNAENVAQPTMSGIGTTFSTVPLSSNKSDTLSKKTKKNKKANKLSKADIGMPTDFKHVSHFGFKASTGLEFKKVDNLDPELEKFFEIVGVSEHQLKDKETRDFIYNFIDNCGGIEKVKKENAIAMLKPRAPPPVPNRELPPTPKLSTRGAAPPPPPARMTPNIASPSKNLSPPPPPPLRPPVGPNMKGNAPMPPPPPPLIGPSTTAPPPPPPPPPPENMFPGPPPPPMLPLADNSPFGSGLSSAQSDDPRSALLAQIRQGKTLQQVQHVEAEAKPEPVDSRNALLQQIRLGVELKTVSESPKSRPPSPPPTGTISIADALKKALEDRAKALQFSDHSDSDDDDDDGFDDDDWNN